MKNHLHIATSNHRDTQRKREKSSRGVTQRNGSLEGKCNVNVPVKAKSDCALCPDLFCEIAPNPHSLVGNSSIDGHFGNHYNYGCILSRQQRPTK